MKMPEEVKKSLECCSPEDGLDPFCNDCPYKKEKWCADTRNADALAYIQQLEANWQQVSKALCGKENATLDEVLQAVSQVKQKLYVHPGCRSSGKTLIMQQAKRIAELEHELAAVKRERDALYCDLSTREDACDVCKHGCLYKHDCEELFGETGCSFEWQGVCSENTEVQE